MTQAPTHTSASKWVKIGLALGLVGLGGWATRWVLQGGSLVYTDLARHFWVPDPTLGWVETPDVWVWLGLDGLGLLGAIVVGTFAVTWFGHRGRGTKPEAVARLLSKLGALLSAVGPVLPALAFVSGMPPEGAERLMPDVAAATPTTETNAPLDVPGGRWTVGESPSNLLVARIAAGGETFDGKFGPLSGEATLVPEDLRQSSARFDVPSASIDTGVALRDNHARGYLGAENHPKIGLVISSFSAVRPGSPDSRNLAGEARVDIMGKTLTVPLEGSLTVLDAAARTRLAVKADHAVLVSASFKVGVSAAGLNRANFDADDITLNARFVMVKAP